MLANTGMQGTWCIRETEWKWKAIIELWTGNTSKLKLYMINVNCLCETMYNSLSIFHKSFLKKFPLNVSEASIFSTNITHVGAALHPKTIYCENPIQSEITLHKWEVYTSHLSKVFKPCTGGNFILPTCPRYYNLDLCGSLYFPPVQG